MRISTSVMPAWRRRLSLLRRNMAISTGVLQCSTRPASLLAGLVELHPALHVVLVARVLVGARRPHVGAVAVLVAGAAELHGLAPRVERLLGEVLPLHEVLGALRAVA